MKGLNFSTPFGSSGIGCENAIMTKVRRYFDVCKDKEVIDQWATVKRNVQTKTILPKDKKVIFFAKMFVSICMFIDKKYEFECT